MTDTIHVKTVQELKNAIDSKEFHTIIDVRTVEEYKRSHIEGSINIPVDQVGNKIESIIQDKSTVVYVYCLSGSRSIYAVSQMMSMGYTNVFDVSHGLLAWRVSRYPEVT